MVYFEDGGRDVGVNVGAKSSIPNGQRDMTSVAGCWELGKDKGWTADCAESVGCKQRRI